MSANEDIAAPLEDEGDLTSEAWPTGYLAVIGNLVPKVEGG